MDKPGRLEVIVYALVILCLLLPWLWIQVNLSINVDIAFLTQSAVYFLSGEKMSEAYYDTNPPLSILVYVIPAALVKFANIPIIYATLFYNIALVGFSGFLTYQALKPFPTLSATEKLVILGAFILSNTIAANLYLGEKDQFILLGVFPFTLMQLALTQRLSIEKHWFWTTGVMASIVLMVKPHFYIVPAVMLLHRMIVQKRLWAFLDRDALALIAAAAAYSAILFLWFDDFISIILPDILTLYASMKEEWVSSIFLMSLAFAGVLAIPALLLTKKTNPFIMLFLILECLCMVPYLIQGKGFYYHAIPAAIFLFCAFTLLLSNLLTDLLSKWTNQKLTQNIALFLPLLTLALLQYSIFLPEGKSPALTHAQYREMPLTKLVDEACENKRDCTFFLFNDMTEIIHQTAAYSGHQHASRFSSFWFMPAITDPDNQSLSPQKKEELARKYSALVAEDFQKFKPEILIIGRFDLKRAGEIFDFKEFFSEYSQEFASAFTHYTFNRTISFNQQEYFPDTLVSDRIMTYDIYNRVAKKQR